MYKTIPFIVFIALSLLSCKESESPSLPYLGTTDPSSGKILAVENFQLSDQHGLNFDSRILKDKVFVTAFFFTHCPTICPKMSHHMKVIQDHFGKTEKLHLLSITADPKRDTVEALLLYSLKLQADLDNWSFLTGSKKEIKNVSDIFKSQIEEGSNFPGGINHSGMLTMIDQNGMVRGYYDGTNEESVRQMIRDIEKLFKENTP